MNLPKTSTPVKVKGIREGLLITIAEDESWENALQALFQLLSEQETFFQGARLVLDVGTRKIRAAALGKLRDQLADHGVTLWAVLSRSSQTQANAQALGLATQISRPRSRRATARPRVPEAGEEALFVPRTLRSGMKVEYPGHVVVLGHVHPGAEIIAGGSVIVWGRLRGMVHAGAYGDTKAVVCALDLAPTQLRIADRLATAPAREGPPQPEIARLQNDQVVAEPWDARP